MDITPNRMAFEVISERLRVLGVLDMWREKHFIDGRWRGEAKRGMYDRLSRMDLNKLTIPQLNYEVGFTLLDPIPPCGICGFERDVVVKTVILPERIVYICFQCAQQITDLITFLPIPDYKPVVGPVLQPYMDGGSKVLRFHGKVKIGGGEDNITEDEGEYLTLWVGSYNVIESVEWAFQNSDRVTVALADERLDGDLYADSGRPGYSEYTPGSSSELLVGPHNLIDILRRHEGKVVTLWIADGPFEVLVWNDDEDDWDPFEGDEEELDQ